MMRRMVSMVSPRGLASKISGALKQRRIALVPVYLGTTLKAGIVWNDRDDMGFNDLIISGSMFLDLDSPVGPV